MAIVEKCVHGERVVSVCRECKKLYVVHERIHNRAGYIWRVAKCRARRKGKLFTIPRSSIIIPSHCIVLGIPLDSRNRDYNPTIDEIIPGLGYVPGNVEIISGRANRIKSDASLRDIQAIECYMRMHPRRPSSH